MIIMLLGMSRDTCNCFCCGGTVGYPCVQVVMMYCMDDIRVNMRMNNNNENRRGGDDGDDCRGGCFS